VKVLPISTPPVMNKCINSFRFYYVTSSNIKYYSLFTLEITSKTLGRHNLIICVNITWIMNSWITYVWLNILTIDIIWFHSYTTNNNLWYGDLMSTLQNLSIHMFMSFLVVNSKDCDSMFTQLIICALLFIKLCLIFFH